MVASTKEAQEDFRDPPATSTVTGKGWGSDHDWRYTAQMGRTTLYTCAACRRLFGHHYPSIPSIFKAMFMDGVENLCNKRNDSLRANSKGKA